MNSNKKPPSSENPDEKIYATETEWVDSYMVCSCKEKKPVLIQYGYNDPNAYDGVSEIKCCSCGSRWGRWTRKELKEGECEPRYGVRK